MNVKEAIAKAKEYASELLENEAKSHFRLEEVVFNEMEGFWEITLGYAATALMPRSSNEMLLKAVDPLSSGDRDHVYKVFKIRDRDGSLVSMNLRELTIDVP